MNSGRTPGLVWISSIAGSCMYQVHRRKTEKGKKKKRAKKKGRSQQSALYNIFRGVQEQQQAERKTKNKNTKNTKKGKTERKIRKTTNENNHACMSRRDSIYGKNTRTKERKKTKNKTPSNVYNNYDTMIPIIYYRCSSYFPLSSRTNSYENRCAISL